MKSGIVCSLAPPGHLDLWAAGGTGAGALQGYCSCRNSTPGSDGGFRGFQQAETRISLHRKSGDKSTG